MVLWPGMMDVGHPLTSRWVWPKCLKYKNTKSEKVSGVSLVRKIKSTSPFLTAFPIEAVRDALTGRRSAARTATKTRRCDLWGCPAPSKAPAELLCFLWDGEAERGRPSAFLWHARSHGKEQRALFSADRLCVRVSDLVLPPSLPPALLDEYVSFAVVRGVKYGQTKTQNAPVDETCVHKIWPFTESAANLRPQRPTMTKAAGRSVRRKNWWHWFG